MQKQQQNGSSNLIFISLMQIIITVYLDWCEGELRFLHRLTNRLAGDSYNRSNRLQYR